MKVYVQLLATQTYLVLLWPYALYASVAVAPSPGDAVFRDLLMKCQSFVLSSVCGKGAKSLYVLNAGAFTLCKHSRSSCIAHLRGLTGICRQKLPASQLNEHCCSGRQVLSPTLLLQSQLAPQTLISYPPNAIMANSYVFWVIMKCSPLKVNRHFVGTFRLHLQGRRIRQAINQQDELR
jgi:hypothetical protein